MSLENIVIENACDAKFYLLEKDLLMYILLIQNVYHLIINVFQHYMMIVCCGIVDKVMQAWI